MQMAYKAGATRCLIRGTKIISTSFPSGQDTIPQQSSAASLRSLTWVGRVTVRIKFNAQDSIAMSQASVRIRTVRSGDAHAKHKASASLTKLTDCLKSQGGTELKPESNVLYLMVALFHFLIIRITFEAGDLKFPGKILKSFENITRGTQSAKREDVQDEL